MLTEEFCIFGRGPGPSESPAVWKDAKDDKNKDKKDKKDKKDMTRD